MNRTTKITVGLILMGSGLLLTTGALLALVMAPPVYEATARIAVPNPPWPARSSDTGANALPFDPYWIQTEFEKLQAKVTLYPVITNLNLTSSWAKKRGTKTSLGMEATYRLLKRQVEIRQLRCTSLIEIVAISEDPAEAAQIANTIASVYRNLRNLGRKIQGTTLPTEVIEIVDAAEPPIRPATGRSSIGILPLVLFGVGLLDILVGYLVIHPALAPRSH